MISSIWYQVFLSNNHMVSSNYFYLIIVIYTQWYGFKLLVIVSKKINASSN